MESDFGNTENIDAIADAFIANCVEYIKEHNAGFSDMAALVERPTLQGLIDNVDDHNERMLEAITAVSPDVCVFIESLMLIEDDEDATLAWQHSMNACFNAVKRRLAR